MDEYGRKALLFDMYGPLLTERQQEIYNYVYGEDMSLGEIAEELSISRQGVYDAIKRTDYILEGYEIKLGLAEKFMEISSHVDAIREKMMALDKNKENVAEIEDIISEINAIDALERR